MSSWTSLVVQWLRLCALTAGDMGLIPGWGTKNSENFTWPKKTAAAGRQTLGSKPSLGTMDWPTVLWAVSLTGPPRGSPTLRVQDSKPGCQAPISKPKVFHKAFLSSVTQRMLLRISCPPPKCSSQNSCASFKAQVPMSLPPGKPTVKCQTAELIFECRPIWCQTKCSC